MTCLHKHPIKKIYKGFIHRFHSDKPHDAFEKHLKIQCKLEKKPSKGSKNISSEFTCAHSSVSIYSTVGSMNICLSSSEIFKLHMMKIRSYKGVDMLARPLLNCCCQSWLVICCNVLHRTFEYTARKKNETYETC